MSSSLFWTFCYILHHFPPALHWQAGERQTKVTFLAFATTHQLQNNFVVCWNAFQIKICLFNWPSVQTNHFFEDISPLFGVTWTCQQFSFIGKVFFFAKENCDFICRQLHSRKSERWKDLKDYVPKKCFLSPGGIFQTFSKPASHRGKKLPKNIFWTCKEYNFASIFLSEAPTHDTKVKISGGRFRRLADALPARGRVQACQDLGWGPFISISLVELDSISAHNPLCNPINTDLITTPPRLRREWKSWFDLSQPLQPCSCFKEQGS